MTSDIVEAVYGFTTDSPVKIGNHVIRLDRISMVLANSSEDQHKNTHRLILDTGDTVGVRLTKDEFESLAMYLSGN